jgi:hypothetical protein
MRAGQNKKIKGEPQGHWIGIKMGIIDTIQ